MIICFKCRREMRCEMNGVQCHYGFGHVYAGDLFRCPSCHIEIVHTNLSANHIDPEKLDKFKTLEMEPGFILNKPIKAFTWIEVLVCIAIIAILTAMILPAIQRYKAHKQGVTAASNTTNGFVFTNPIVQQFERFTVSKQVTPLGYPDLVLIHDNLHGTEVLYIRNMDNDGCAVVLPRREPGTISISPSIHWNRPDTNLIVTNSHVRFIEVEQ